MSPNPGPPAPGLFFFALVGRRRRPRLRRQDPHPPLDPGQWEGSLSFLLCFCHVLISSSSCSRPETFLAPSLLQSFRPKKAIGLEGDPWHDILQHHDTTLLSETCVGDWNCQSLLSCRLAVSKMGKFSIYVCTYNSGIIRGKFCNLRPHSQRFCDVAVTVKFYLKCDVAKSFRMGPPVFSAMVRLSE